MVIFTCKRWSVKLLEQIFAIHKLLLGKEPLVQVTDLLGLTEKGQLTSSGPLGFHSAITQQ